MDYLARNDAPFSSELWEQIDQTVISSAIKGLTARRFIPVVGPVGAGVQFATIDAQEKSEDLEDGFIKTTNRQVAEIPQLYSDFWLYWRDLEASKISGIPIDLSNAMFAAQKLAQTENKLIFHGNSALGLDGLLTVKGSSSIKRTDWSSGENAFINVAEAILKLEQSKRYGRYTLVLSPNLFVQLQRIQPGTGILEIDRIASLIGGKVLKSSVLKDNTAFLVCSESYCMDLLIGQDVSTGFLETVEMNHRFRLLETIMLRIKCPDAIVIFK